MKKQTTKNEFFEIKEKIKTNPYEAKLKSLTIEPIVAYTYAKQTEIKNIRIIFTGKFNNISAEKIKERLRESYV